MNHTYPNITNKDLRAIYRLDTIKVHFVSSGMIEFSVYTSIDGENFDSLKNIKIDIEKCPDGVLLNCEGRLARFVRVFSEYASDSTEIFVNQIDVKGEKTNLPLKENVPVYIENFEDSKYNVSISREDTIAEVYGIVYRNLGEKYCDWFVFELEDGEKYDYFTLKNCNNRIKITANSGVCLARGLNYYLKQYCNVHISQVGSQVNMPKGIVPVECEIHRETKTKIRYAYNYCTHSYTMAFWGENEWRKELDWLALNGVNLVLDITAQEEVWRRFLGKIGYSLDEIKGYIAGPAFYAWAYMANLFGHGGPVHNSWFAKRTELARKNQFIMRRLGMKPILQGYSGMVPTDIERYDGSVDVIPQGKWSSVERPYMLKTVSKCFDKYAKLFYAAQQEVYGNITDYFATDPFHEGGNTANMQPADVSSGVLKAMLNYNENAVWIIQAWEGNPKSELLAGLDRIENGKKHAIILDLYAEKQPHNMEGAPDKSSYGYSPEFDKTPWIYCMINNFGGRLGIYGHMDNIVTKVPQALNERRYNVGIGIAPEASFNNPVLYELLFDCIWQADADMQLAQVELDTWISNYCKRRYGTESKSCEEAMLILKNTVYNSKYNDIAQGAPEAISNARPALEIKAASTWGNAIIKYDNGALIKAAELFLADYELLKNQETYIYDAVSIIQQILSNEIFDCHAKLRDAYLCENLNLFISVSENFLNIIDLMERVTSCSEHYLLGAWIEKARALSADTDDFTKMIFEMNAKELITTWGSYDMAKTLHDYSNRQWSGLLATFYKPRWEYWIGEMIKSLEGNLADICPDWFGFEWRWVREQRDFSIIPEKYNLKDLFQTIVSEKG